MTDPDPLPPPNPAGPGSSVPSSAGPSVPQPRLLPSGNDKIWAILSHLSSFIGVPFILPLVVYLAMRGESQYVALNAREALNFHLSLIIYGVGCTLLALTIIAIPLVVVLGAALAIAGLVLAIIAAIKAGEGECYRYPLTIRIVG